MAGLGRKLQRKMQVRVKEGYSLRAIGFDSESAFRMLIIEEMFSMLAAHHPLMVEPYRQAVNVAARQARDRILADAPSDKFLRKVVRELKLKDFTERTYFYAYNDAAAFTMLKAYKESLRK